MRRTKKWWALFTPEERSYIIYFERQSKKFYGLGGYYPDEYGECSVCSQPCLMGGTCDSCSDKYNIIVTKAEGLK